jgi:hypothetical protein
MYGTGTSNQNSTVSSGGTPTLSLPGLDPTTEGAMMVTGSIVLLGLSRLLGSMPDPAPLTTSMDDGLPTVGSRTTPRLLRTDAQAQAEDLWYAEQANKRGLYRADEGQTLAAREYSELDRTLDDTAGQAGRIFAQLAEGLLPSYLGQNAYVDQALEWVGTNVAETYAANPLREIVKITDAIRGQTANGLPLTESERAGLFLDVGKSELLGHATDLLKEKASHQAIEKVQGMLIKEAPPPPLHISGPYGYSGSVDAGTWESSLYLILSATTGA